MKTTSPSLISWTFHFLMGLFFTYTDALKRIFKDIQFLLKHGFFLILALLHVLIPAAGVFVLTHWSEATQTYFYSDSALFIVLKLSLLYAFATLSWGLAFIILHTQYGQIKKLFQISYQKGKTLS